MSNIVFVFSQFCLSPLVHMGMNPVPPFEAPGPLQLKISSQRTACTVCDTAGPTLNLCFPLMENTVSKVINKSACSNSDVVAISDLSCHGKVLGTILVGRPAAPGQRIKVWLAQFFLGSNVWHVWYTSQSDDCGASSVSSHRASSMYITAERFGRSCGPESTNACALM